MKALQHSIEHWERLVSLAQAQDAPGLIGEGWCGDSCALCYQYSDLPACDGCPVAIRTGESDCAGSPWINASAVLNIVTITNASPDDWAQVIYAVTEELNFLRSLEW